MGDAYGLQHQLQGLQNVYFNLASQQAMLNGQAWNQVQSSLTNQIGGYGLPVNGGAYSNSTINLSNPNMQQALQAIQPQKSRHISNIAWLDSRVNEIRVKL